MKGVSTIIWDWNGTLLNDVKICIDTINQLLLDRKLPILSEKKYLETFGFPVKDYYRRIGFDFTQEPFEVPAHQYIKLYSSKLSDSKLHSGVLEVLDFFSEKGFRQLVLSASEQLKLEEAIQLFHIDRYFEAMAGLDNHFATSKTEIGINLLKRLGINPAEVCLIGDTSHDYHVARAIGCQCLLIANGHQSIKKLEETEALLIENIGELKTLF